jgi:pimeloyl-ACP methyl ester carboxylesterase
MAADEPIWPPYSIAGFDRAVHDIGGVETVVYTIGAGPTVLYFHGGGTFHGFEWARDWAGRFRVVVPHHPGFGESGDSSFATIAAYVAHYAELLDRIGSAGVYLVGASLGGRMAAEFAAREPDRVRALVLVSPAGLSDPTVPPVDLSAVAPDELRHWFAHRTGFIDRFWPASTGPAFDALRRREHDAAFRIIFDPANDEAALGALLPRITAPTLLLWGAQDRIVPPALAGVWARRIAGATSEIVPDAGHLLLDEAADSRAAAFTFFSRHL